MSKIRVRFAPSPTGPLHIGGVRTALYNYLFAKRNNGDFLLRIEDTDQTRYVDGAENYIIESLKWCGLKFDEGVGIGGQYGPYRQSERKEIYKQYAINLVNNGWAYYAFDSEQDLEKMRQELEAEKALNLSYCSFNRLKMNNSLTLSNEVVESKLNNNEPYVIRFKIPAEGEISFNDIIRGEIKINLSTLDDKVLFKSDGMPTYHLANVVDDYLMKITHVIRGEEWLPSLALHVLLYKSLGWEDSMPKFAHLPLLLKPDGKGKLSKRDGDRLGFPVFPLQWKDPITNEITSGYRESGYLPDSFINMLALLGWNSGTEQEVFTMQELINNFSLEKVGKSGSKFSPEKAKWFNHNALTSKTDAELSVYLLDVLKSKNINIDSEKATKICSLIKDRIYFIQDLWEQSKFFYVAPESYDEKVVSKRWTTEIPQILNNLIDIYNNLNNFNANDLKQETEKFINDNNLNFGQILNVLRLSLVGGSIGPDLFTIVEILGKEEAISRIKLAIVNIKI